MLNYQEILEKAQRHQQLNNRIKQTIINRLNLELEPNDISNDQPLFGRGLGLDSIDALELFVAIEDEFGVTIYDDNMEVFGSINKLADYIIENDGV